MEAGNRRVRKRPLTGDEQACIQRTARVTLMFLRNEPVTVTAVMHVTGLTRPGAHYLLRALADVLGLYDESGVWRMSVPWRL